MFAILLLLIFVRPFLCSLAFPFPSHVYGIALMSFLALWCLFKGMPREKIGTIRLPLLFFCFALFLSVVFSKNVLYSSAELFKYVSGLLLLAIASSLTLKDKHLIIKVISFGALIICFLAINQYFFEFSFFKRYLAIHRIADPFLLEYASRKRVFFPFLTPNALAGYLGMVIPFFLINKKRAWFSIPLFAAIFLTQSIGALMSLLVSFCLFFILQSKTKNREVFFFLAFTVACLLVFSFRNASSLRNNEPLFSGLMRIEYWKQTVALIKAHPFVGLGIGNFDIFFSRYAHNLYLQLWAESGIFGLLTFLWLVISIIKNALKALDPLKEDHRFTISLIAAVVFFLVHNAFDFTFYLPEVSMAWWILLGLML